ncbi:hypothetical protein RF11_00990 [Thelohanellus kitauei]|uniref:Uncharacterized protein n=1 Tax=Thelohanellus kitauei TaxID=669202 RepID=A0A0C2INM1_THEKT|nr:hypothetical protein RF11_00990 [Thelohanellus kitauei]
MYRIEFSGWRCEFQPKLPKEDSIPIVLYDQNWKNITIKFSIIDVGTKEIETSSVNIENYRVKYPKTKDNIEFIDISYTSFDINSRKDKISIQSTNALPLVFFEKTVRGLSNKNLNGYLIEYSYKNFAFETTTLSLKYVDPANFLSYYRHIRYDDEEVLK